MEERDIKNVIIHTINNIPIPWEKLWNIFQKSRNCGSPTKKKWIIVLKKS